MVVLSSRIFCSVHNDESWVSPSITNLPELDCTRSTYVHIHIGYHVNEFNNYYEDLNTRYMYVAHNYNMPATSYERKALAPRLDWVALSLTQLYSSSVKQQSNDMLNSWPTNDKLSKQLWLKSSSYGRLASSGDEAIKYSHVHFISQLQ